MAPNFNARIKPVDPERFQFAMGAFNAAVAIKGPYKNPANYRLIMTDEKDGSASELRFTDIPINRGMLAVKNEFTDPDEFQCIGFRILTMSDVVKMPQLRKIGVIRDEDGVLEMHEAVVNALATAPFKKSGALDKPAFIKLVKSEFQRIGEAS